MRKRAGSMSKNNNTLVEVQDLMVYFPVHVGSILKRKIGDIKAVDGINFRITQGETMGLVGESGSGKTTTGQAILQIDQPTGGKIFFEGEEVTGLGKKEIRHLRRRMQMIFQDPFGSLNPRMKVRDIIGEPLKVHNMVTSRAEYRDRVTELLLVVGLDPAMGERYPHEFSGGQRQRIGVARALAVRPSFIVCDEPVSALDVSIQAQIINLLEDLQEQFNLTYLFIAHDLSVVRHISDRIAVMYLGEIVEIASRIDLYRNPLHPYTRALLAAVPIPNPTLEAQREHILIHGEIPSPLNPPSGCRFHPRCLESKAECSVEVPTMHEVDPGHFVTCLLKQ
jgi:oligopeptide transport system ATP-binding protein